MPGHSPLYEDLPGSSSAAARRFLIGASVVAAAAVTAAPGSAVIKPDPGNVIETGKARPVVIKPDPGNVIETGKARHAAPKGVRARITIERRTHQL